MAQTPDTPDLVVQPAQTLLAEMWKFVENLFLTWRLYQIAIIVGCFGLAHLLRLVIAPRLYEWMRHLEGRPKWQLRALLMVHQRVQLICFVALTWGVLFVMREVTWPSRSYLIGLIATLGLAWLLVGFATRLIVNRPLRRLIKWSAWVFVTLQILGFWPSTSAFLDSLFFEFGDLRLSLLLVIKGFFVTALLFIGARLVTAMTTRQIHLNEDISPSMQVLLAKLLQIFLFGAALMIGLKSIGFDLTSLALFSGAVGVGLGFGLQKIVSNLVSGFILLVDKSIKPGDVISLGETFGWIDSLGARYVSVVTRDGREYLIPNEDLITNQVVNWSHSNDLVRLDITFGASYTDDPHVVRKISTEAAKTVKRVRAVPSPVCHIVGFGDNSIDYILRFWIADPSTGLTNVRGHVYLALWDALTAHGISVPFPQREVRVLSDPQPKPAKPPPRKKS